MMLQQPYFAVLITKALLFKTGLFVTRGTGGYMYLVFDTHAEVARHVAQQTLKRLQKKPSLTLGLATGSTMEPIYAELLGLIAQHQLDLAHITTFNLDEYVGLSKSHPQSYYHYMCRHFFSQLNVPQERIHLPNGKAQDLAAECQRFNALCRQHSTDYQLLGVGTNGHIGFNEPGTPFDSITHVVELTAQTRLDNSRFFPNPSDMPQQAITMGFEEIMQAKEIVLVVTGKHKAEVVANFHHSAITETLSVSILKKHPQYTVVLDKAAASLLPVGAATPVACTA